MTTLTSTPRQDGYYMPAEWAPHSQTWMVWPERPDNWRNGGKPAQAAFTAVAKAIAQFEPVTVCVSAAQYENARARLDDDNIRLVEITTDDAWVRDTGPTFVINDSGDVRGVDWAFNAWGGFDGGLYWPWLRDDQVARKILEIEEQQVKQMCDKILEFKPDLVFTEKGVSDLAQHFLLKANVTCIRRVRKSDNNRIARATGAQIVNRVDDLRDTDVGTRCGLFHVEKLGDEYVKVSKS